VSTVATAVEGGRPRRRLPGEVRRLGVLFRTGFRAELQYRGNFLASILGAAAFQGMALAFVGVVVHRFGSIGGWGMAEIAFLYGIRMVSHGVCTVPLGQLWGMDEVVREGDFDRYLLRPTSTYVQVITRRFPILAVGDILLGVAVLGSVSAIAPVDWSPRTVGYLLAAVIGGGLMEGAILTTLSALAFRFMGSYSLNSFVDNIFTTFGTYPLAALGPVVSYGLTFVVPLAFVAYFPATVLLGRTGELFVPVWLAMGAPVVGAFAYVGSLWFFARQTRHYASPGH
jgi:ABC-2 type transport system permease protein